MGARGKIRRGVRRTALRVLFGGTPPAGADTGAAGGDLAGADGVGTLHPQAQQAGGLHRRAGARGTGRGR
eukprot:2409677-Pleurochrysis_carterae.AAC.1